MEVFKKRSKSAVVTVSGPVIGPDGVCVADDFDRFEMVKLDRSSLAEAWRIKKTKRYRPFDASNGNLYGAGEARVGRFDTATGRLLWEVSSDGDGFHWFRGRIVIRRAGSFELVDPSSGAIVDRVPMPQPDLERFAVMGDRFVLQENFGARPDPIVCFDLHERKVVWEQPLLVQIRERFGIDHHTRVIVFIPGSSSGLFIVRRGTGTCGVSAEDGRIVWGVPLDLGYGRADVHDGRVYGLLQNRLVALDEATGAVVYDRPYPELTGVVYPRPGVFFRGLVAYVAESGHLAVFDVADGSLVAFTLHRGGLSQVVEADSRLLATTAADGNLLVFEGV